jgi:hypothetical protein
VHSRRVEGYAPSSCESEELPVLLRIERLDPTSPAVILLALITDAGSILHGPTEKVLLWALPSVGWEGDPTQRTR